MRVRPPARFPPQQSIQQHQNKRDNFNPYSLTFLKKNLNWDLLSIPQSEEKNGFPKPFSASSSSVRIPVLQYDREHRGRRVGVPFGVIDYYKRKTFQVAFRRDAFHRLRYIHKTLAPVRIRHPRHSFFAAPSVGLKRLSLPFGRKRPTHGTVSSNIRKHTYKYFRITSAHRRTVSVDPGSVMYYSVGSSVKYFNSLDKGTKPN